MILESGDEEEEGFSLGPWPEVAGGDLDVEGEAWEARRWTEGD